MIAEGILPTEKAHAVSQAVAHSSRDSKGHGNLRMWSSQPASGRVLANCVRPVARSRVKVKLYATDISVLECCKLKTSIAGVHQRAGPIILHTPFS